ncbi:endo alpha-1,4 polygalactosaminidase [Streptomyces sp. M2CJ-2]|uniref:endo alpha-1,4 polygalactosaminidase n=1 Tax=Streptomyces sp. M2CJ-2 TaxID=2803948 RepID=UPI001925A4AF|nr:endo alpha-1,4 polygalactosaminidase [Streptomyces sp. M2CJ-2]MBL3671368.1 endo alpha-1,4 polygalactosaminidase [Streptomyces sp. M2CJ-2]
MSADRFTVYRSAALLTVAAVLTACTTTTCSSDGGDDATRGASAVTTPPAHAGFDYQLGGAYPPPEGVEVVVRDHTASPAPGLYNVCYVNAFQAQPDAEDTWEPDLLLRERDSDRGGDPDGKVVMDTDWDEALLDIGTAGKRERIAEKVNGWIDTCADKGFDAVEPDNYDSYARAPKGLLGADDAKAFLTLLAAHAHDRGLAIAQKNTAELAPAREEVGADFAVVEECGRYDECGDYADAFGDRVLVVEYEAAGLDRACDGWGDELSVILRDLDVTPEGSPGYVRETCGHA